MKNTEIIGIDSTNTRKYPLCFYKNTAKDEYIAKSDWISGRLKEGLRYKVLKQDKSGIIGMIEYIPGENAWRPVDCKQYMFIHCLLIDKKDTRGNGLGRSLVKHCIDDAKKSGFDGVAVLTRKSSWMAGSGIFIKNGFEIADTFPKGFELLALRFKDTKMPSFSFHDKEVPDCYKKGLFILYSNQCPYVRKFLNDIPPTIKKFGIEPKIIELDKSEKIREIPNPYGTFTIIYNGKILEDHPISNTRFVNILKNDVL